MAGISIITNFDLNAPAPIDSRMVATNSIAREGIVYKYKGLKVFQEDTLRTYIWSGATWSFDGDGIYGGSGSLTGNTVISTGIIGNTSSNTSNVLSLSTNTSTDSVNYSTYFNRHSNGTDWTGVEAIVQYSHTGTSGSYISFNPFDQSGNQGGLALGTGDGVTYPLSEKLRILPSGNVGIKTINPKGHLQISDTIGQPLVFNYVSPVGATANKVIGYNFSDDSTNGIFATSKGSSYIKFDDDGTIVINTRNAGTPYNLFNSIATFKYNGVGINRSPDHPLDVIGIIRNSDNIIFGNTTGTYSVAIGDSGLVVNRIARQVHLSSSNNLDTKKSYLTLNGFNSEVSMTLNNLLNKPDHKFGIGEQRMFVTTSGNYGGDLLTGIAEVYESKSWTGSGINTGVIKTLSIPNMCVLEVEVTYSSVIVTGAPITIATTRLITQNKITMTLKVDLFGNITQVGSTVTYFSNRDNTILNFGYVDISTPYFITIKQDWQNPSPFMTGATRSANLRASYKILTSYYL